MLAIAAAIGLGVFVLVGALNHYTVVRDWKTSREGGAYPSTVPLVGGLAGMSGCLGFAPLQTYAWVPLVLDPGTAGFLLLALPGIIKERWQFSSFNLLREYRATDSPAKTAILRLFKTGLFVLRLDFNRTAGELGISQFTRTGTWQQTAAGLNLMTRDGKSAQLTSQHEGQAAPLAVTSDFPTFQIDAELALAGLVFVEAPSPASQSG